MGAILLVENQSDFATRCLNTASSYFVNFDIYQGKNPRGNLIYEKQFGKCIALLISMRDELPEKELPYRLYFDNLLTGFNVLYYLKLFYWYVMV